MMHYDYVFFFFFFFFFFFQVMRKHPYKDDGECINDHGS